MLRNFVLENGKLKPCKDKQHDKVLWCDAIQPNDNELIEIAQNFDINLEDLQDCLDETERPRYNFDLILQNNFILLRVIRNLESETGQRPTVPLGIFYTKKEQLITIRFKSLQAVDNAFEGVFRRKIENGWILILELIHILIQQMENRAQSIGTQIRELQMKILSSTKQEEISFPFQLNSDLIFFNTAMLGNFSAIKSFHNRVRPTLEKNLSLLEKFDDLQTDIEQVYTFSSIYRDLMNNTLQAYSSMISNNLSNVMKVVASISLIFMIPTLIASFYGMNVFVPGGTEKGNPFVFFIILIFSLGLSVLIWTYFRKKRWL